MFLLKLLLGTVVGIGTIIAISSVTDKKPKEEEKPSEEESGGKFSLSNVPLTETDKFILGNCKDTNFLRQYFSEKDNNSNRNNNKNAELFKKISSIQEAVSKVKGIMDLTVNIGVDIVKLFNYNQQQPMQLQPQQVRTGWRDSDGVYIYR